MEEKFRLKQRKYFRIFWIVFAVSTWPTVYRVFCFIRSLNQDRFLRETVCKIIVIPDFSGIPYCRNLWFRHAECTNQNCDFGYYCVGTKAVISLPWVLDETCDSVMWKAGFFWIKSVILSYRMQAFWGMKSVIPLFDCHGKCKEKVGWDLWFRNFCAHSFLPNHTCSFKSNFMPSPILQAGRKSEQLNRRRRRVRRETEQTRRLWQTPSTAAQP